SVLEPTRLMCDTRRLAAGLRRPERTDPPVDVGHGLETLPPVERGAEARRVEPDGGARRRRPAREGGVDQLPAEPLPAQVLAHDHHPQPGEGVAVAHERGRADELAAAPRGEGSLRVQRHEARPVGLVLVPAHARRQPRRGRHVGGREGADARARGLAQPSHSARWARTNSSSVRSRCSCATLALSSAWPVERPSPWACHQTPSRRPCRRMTSCTPAITPWHRLAASNTAAFASVRRAARVRSSAGTWAWPRRRLTSSSSATAARVHTAHWPSSPPTIRFSTTRPSTTTRNGVRRSTRMLSSLPV